MDQSASPSTTPIPTPITTLSYIAPIAMPMTSPIEIHVHMQAPRALAAPARTDLKRARAREFRTRCRRKSCRVSIPSAEGHKSRWPAWEPSIALRVIPTEARFVDTDSEAFDGGELQDAAWTYEESYDERAGLRVASPCMTAYDREMPEVEIRPA